MRISVLVRDLMKNDKCPVCGKPFTAVVRIYTNKGVRLEALHVSYDESGNRKERRCVLTPIIPYEEIEK